MTTEPLYRATTHSLPPSSVADKEMRIQFSGTLLEVVEWATFHNLTWTEQRLQASMPRFCVERHDLKPLDSRERRILGGCRSTEAMGLT